MRFERETDKTEAPEFQMAPMIDIIFLLLIFFMVASTFHQVEQTKEVKLPVADKSQTKKSAYGEIVINVRMDGGIVVGDKEYGLEGLLSILEEEAASFEMGKKVTIRGDRGVSHASVRNVMKICTLAGIFDVSFATFQEEPG